MPTEIINTEQPMEILSVSALNASARHALERSLQTVWVSGEISNLIRASSGHYYFSLKDSQSQVRCALFRGYRQRLLVDIENGLEVLVRAQVSIYEARGDFQLIIQHIDPLGNGKLQLEFEKLKKQLAKDGLFDETHKKSLPTFPSRIGVITSPTGAAIRDILNVLKRRCANIPVTIYPTLVQGNQAALQIVNAITLANQHKACDILIVARGGGSLEDLWPFNEKIVAQAIYASTIPIVSGVGHEVDFTITDFVADRRAPTPSAAAELVSPNRQDLLKQITRYYQQLCHLINSEIKRYQTHLSHLQKSLQHPGQRIQQQMQQLDHLEHQLNLACKNYLKQQFHRLTTLMSQLLHASPAPQIERYLALLPNKQQHLINILQYQLKLMHKQIANFATALDSLSPLRTLKRGYAIVAKEKTNQLLTDSRQVQYGEKIKARLAKGELTCIVEAAAHIDC